MAKVTAGTIALELDILEAHALEEMLGNMSKSNYKSFGITESEAGLIGDIYSALENSKRAAPEPPETAP